MLNSKSSLFALALLIPLLGTAIPAEAAQAKKVDATAARAECFRQANAAVAAAGPGAAVQNPEKQAVGYDAYASCCRKAGIRP
jgi:hypothetical protein